MGDDGASRSRTSRSQANSGIVAMKNHNFQIGDKGWVKYSMPVSVELYRDRRGDVTLTSYCAHAPLGDREIPSPGWSDIAMRYLCM